MTELRNQDPYEVSNGEGGLSRLLQPIIERQRADGRKAGSFTKDDDITFAEWVAIVDALIRRKTGVGFFDLPDWCFRDAYDDGCTASEGRDRALEEALDADSVFAMD